MNALPSILPSAENERRKMLNWPSIEEQEAYWERQEPEGNGDMTLGECETEAERNL